MKLVVLGAGASFDCMYDFFDDQKVMPWRPPLANEMFDTRKEFRSIIENYPGGKFYISQINTIEDVEDFFQKQWLFLKTNRAVDLASAFLNLNYCLSSLMYQISSQYKNVGLSNYDILIQKAYEYAIRNKEDVLIVTFNYDLLLEDSLSKLFFGDGRKVDIEHYVKFPIKIIKPHGSCNWVKRFRKDYFIPDGMSVSHHLFQEKVTLRQINEALENQVFAVDNPMSEKYFGKPNQVWNCFPQILVPLKDKDDFILPTLHREYLENNLSKIDEILVVGWKGSEAKFQHLLQSQIGSKKVKITSVNAGYPDIETVLKPYVTNAEFYHYDLTARLTKNDNRAIWENGGVTSREINHAKGTFSSYTINSQKNDSLNFFKS